MKSNSHKLETQQDSAKVTGAIDRFFKNFCVATILHQSGIRKAKGTSALTIMSSIFALAFIGKDFFRGIVQNPSVPFGKDAAYELLKGSCHNWRKVLMMISVKLLAFFNSLTSQTREKVLIIDDSPYDRSRSKKVELLAKVFDHAEKRFIRGFRLLSVCWSDGVSLLPLDFALLSSKDKKNRFQGITKDVDKRSCGYKRRLEAMEKATDLVNSMVGRILSYRIKFNYILMDSWFCWPKVVCALHQYAPVIGMVKKTSKVLYNFGGLELDVKSIYRRLPKRRGRAQILSHALIRVGGIDAKLVFVRDRRKKDWLVLLSTSPEISNEEIVRLYGRRWDIEVFFKMAKQHLKLVKEIQTRDFDTLVAHTSIVFMRYQFLAYEQRIRTDNRTFGQLFYCVYEEMADIAFCESLQRILTMAIDKLRKAGEFSEKIYRKLIDVVMGQAVKLLGLESNQCQITDATA
jgi:hypothetical protein